MAAISVVTGTGIRGELYEQIAKVPQLWPDHVTNVASTTQVESFAMAGALPQPREMADGRRIQGLRAFTYNIENNEYELSVLFDRKLFEDDQTGQLRLRIQEVAQAWAHYKDVLFTEMLVNGGTAGYVAYDGSTFFHDTRTEGDSGTIDNVTTSAAATGTIPTAAEFLSAMEAIKGMMWRYADDQGRVGANWQAMNDVRVIIPPTYERSAKEALDAVMLATTSNVYGQGLAKADINPLLSSDAIMYVHAVGADPKGIIYQQRTPLEIVVYAQPEWVDHHNGMLVTARERFVFAYGQFRRMVQHTFS